MVHTSSNVTGILVPILCFKSMVDRIAVSNWIGLDGLMRAVWNARLPAQKETTTRPPGHLDISIIYTLKN